VTITAITKHGAEFGDKLKDALDYLKAAQDFISRTDVLKYVRANGDKLFYDPITNQFAVQAANGTIRTYFVPVNGIAYWLSQIGGG
jgi:filamentous hemagglutinin